MVCDMGNTGLLSKLGVYSEQKHYFVHPVDQTRKIYIFPDVPHCLKNLRNHTLDYGIVIKQSDDHQISLKKEDFQTLIEADDGDFRLCFKLNMNHINVKGNERQRVKYATQLFSNTVSKAFTFKLGSSYSSQGNIVSVIDSWFDVMDSRNKYHYKKNKCALGKTSNENPTLHQICI